MVAFQLPKTGRISFRVEVAYANGNGLVLSFATRTEPERLFNQAVMADALGNATVLYARVYRRDHKGREECILSTIRMEQGFSRN